MWGKPENCGTIFPAPREIIAYELEAETADMLGGEIEVDESYFGGKRKGITWSR